MDIVSFETAKALKDAGFPAKIRRGCHYYKQSTGDIAYIGEADDEVWVLMCGEYKETINIYEGCYAPTATDILQQIGMAIEWVDTPFDGPYWVCWDNSMTRKYDPTIHDNPAEAAAAMFLQMKNKNG